MASKDALPSAVQLSAVNRRALSKKASRGPGRYTRVAEVKRERC
jgi:hypothetical protein